MANRPTDDGCWLSGLVEFKENVSTHSAAAELEIISDKTLSILHINMRSLVNKMPVFELFLSQLNTELSCIVISETWFSCLEYFPKYFLKGYHLHCSSRPHGGGGGVFVRVREVGG